MRVALAIISAGMIALGIALFDYRFGLIAAGIQGVVGTYVWAYFAARSGISASARRVDPRTGRIVNRP